MKTLAHSYREYFVAKICGPTDMPSEMRGRYYSKKDNRRAGRLYQVGSFFVLLLGVSKLRCVSSEAELRLRFSELSWLEEELDSVDGAIEDPATGSSLGVDGIPKDEVSPSVMP